MARRAPPRRGAETRARDLPSELPSRTQPGRHGGTLRVGNPGHDGRGTGRPPDAWRERLRAICSRDEVLDTLETVLLDSHHPAYVGALKWCAEHGYGKPRESVEITGAGGGPVQVQVWRFGQREVAF